MKKFRKTVGAAALVSIFGFVGAASASTIDLFNAAPPTDPNIVRVGGSNPTPTPAAQFGPSTDIIGPITGGWRDLSLTSVTGQNAVNAATLAVTGGRLTFNNDSGVRSTGTVQWDGNDAATPGNLAFDLNANLINQTGCPPGGCSFFQTTVFSADQGFRVELGIYTDAANFSLLQFTSAAVAAPALTTFEFAWFALSGAQNIGGFLFNVVQGGTGADLTDVGALQLVLSNVSGNAAIDLEIGAVTKQGVPEPSALALAGIALLGAAVAGRRRKSV